MTSGREIVGETLRVLYADMENRVLPKASDPDAYQAAWLIRDLLSYLAVWQLEPPDGLAGHLKARQALIAAGEGGPSALPGDLPMEASSYGQLANALQQRIEDDAGADRGLLAAAVAADRALYADEQSKIRQCVQLAADRLECVEVEVTSERAQVLVDALLGPGYVASSVSKIPGGFSKDSFFLDTRAPNDDLTQFVIRRDLPWGPAQTTVVDEFDLLRRLFESGFPIAEPLGLDKTRILGQPAMLSRRVSGSSGTAPWDADAGATSSVCRELAKTLARLHEIAPAEVGMTYASADPRDQVRAYVIEWRERWKKNRVHPSPTLAAAFVWLLENIPANIERLAIVHGDIGFHNAIVDDGQLVALLDWEFVHVGDPTEDLSYCRQFVEPLTPWDEFLEGYRAAGGGDYGAENAQFFELWRSVRNSITCSVAWRGFLDGAYPALKMAHQGIASYRYFIRNTAEALDGRFK